MWNKNIYSPNTHRDIMMMAEWAYNHSDFPKTATREKHINKGKRFMRKLTNRKYPTLNI